MRVALVHDWLTGMRGGERCLQAFLALYPQADIYTLLHVPGTTSLRIDQSVKGTSFINRLPGARRYYRLLLPLYPLAARSFRLVDYDMVISLSHAVAKNVHVPDSALHLVYCFTPMRYIWDQAHVYFGGATAVMWPLIKALRRWDLSCSERPDQFVAISRFVAARIRCFYGRKAAVVYPPVDASWITPVKPTAAGSAPPGKAFLCAGALVPYKRVDLVVQAFNRLKLPLWVVGSGPEEGKLRRMAKSNISFYGAVSDQSLAEFYRQCRALVFPAREDFGLMPVECMAAGRPVICLSEGGCSETVVGLRPWDCSNNSLLDASQATGVFIRRAAAREVDSLMESIEFFIRHERLFSVEACVRRAAEFSLKSFCNSWNSLPEVAAMLNMPSSSLCQDAQARSGTPVLRAKNASTMGTGSGSLYVRNRNQSRKAAPC